MRFTALLRRTGHPNSFNSMHPGKQPPQTPIVAVLTLSIIAMHALNRFKGGPRSENDAFTANMSDIEP